MRLQRAAQGLIGKDCNRLLGDYGGTNKDSNQRVWQVTATAAHISSTLIMQRLIICCPPSRRGLAGRGFILLACFGPGGLLKISLFSQP
jgi:hypothetical protein